MWSFFFKTMPVTPPPHEWVVAIAVTAVLVLISTGVLALSPSGDPLLRTGITVGLFYATAFGITALRRIRARALGIPFTHTNAAKERLFLWLMSQLLLLALGRVLAFFVPVFLGGTILLRGHQIWQFDASDWRLILHMLAFIAPLGIMSFVVIGYAEWSRRYVAMIWCLVIITLITTISRFIPHDAATVGALLSREWDIASFWIAAAAVLLWRLLWRRTT